VFLVRARFPRVVVVDVPYHITQRANARQVILTPTPPTARAIRTYSSTTLNCLPFPWVNREKLAGQTKNSGTDGTSSNSSRSPLHIRSRVGRRFALSGVLSESAALFVFFISEVIEVTREVGTLAIRHAFAGIFLWKDGLAAIDTHVLLLSLFPH